MTVSFLSHSNFLSQKQQKVALQLGWLSTILIELGSSASKLNKNEPYRLQCKQVFPVINDNFDYAQKILMSIGLNLERCDLSDEMVHLSSMDAPQASTPIEEHSEGNNEWTNVERKQLRRTSNKMEQELLFELRFVQLFPAYVYTKLAGTVDTAIDALCK